MVKVIRHGDLLLHPNDDERNEKMSIKEDNCVLDGEVTGHHHRVGAGATVMLLDGEQTEANDYFRGVVQIPKPKTKADKPTTITHEEHDAIVLQPGKYDAYVQREYNPLENRRVLD